MIHHQHFFPVVSDQGKLLPVFLAVLNMEPEQPDVISRNMERVLTARLRDARFFYRRRSRAAAGRLRRAARARCCSTRSWAPIRRRPSACEQLRALDLRRRCFRRRKLRDHAREAGRLCKADLATDMVRELTELQGTMGGIYAREDGRPEEVWKAIYFHYLPVGVEADAPPTREQLGKAAITWAAVSLADKLDTVDRHVRRRRAAHRIARSVRAAPRRAGHRAHPGRSAGADRARSARHARRAGRACAQLRSAGQAAWTRRSGRSCSTACATCSSSAATTCATCARSRTATIAELSPLMRETQARGAARVHGDRRSSSSSRCCSSA